MSHADPPISFSEVAKFVRLLMHDVRNGLNAIDLEASLISELTTDPELSGEVMKLRGMVSNTARMMQRLSPYLSDVTLNPISCPAQECIAEIRTQIEKKFAAEAGSFDWDTSSVEGNLEVDFELFQQALIEVIGNALAFSDSGERLAILVTVDPSGTQVELTQKLKSISGAPPEEWGTVPFRSTQRGHYGLGLFYARRILEAHRGSLVLQRNEKTGELVTRLIFPIPA